MASVEKYFEDIEETLRLRFRGWEADLSHPGEKGGIRERRVRALFSSVLPKRYGIGTGHVVDSRGGISNQTDIVIYDAIDGMVLPIDEYYSRFPCENVRAVVEVKSKLTAGGTINECIKNTRKIKALDRQRNHNLPPIPSVVFAYETAWRSEPVSRAIKRFAERDREYSKAFPEMVFVLNPGFLFYPSGPSGYSTDDMSELVVIDRVPLLGFISHLHRLISPEGALIPDLWQEYIDWQAGDVIARGCRLADLLTSSL